MNKTPTIGLVSCGIKNDNSFHLLGDPESPSILVFPCHLISIDILVLNCFLGAIYNYNSVSYANHGLESAAPPIIQPRPNPDIPLSQCLI